MKPKNTDLESQVKAVVDSYVMGSLELNGKPLTATAIARVVCERYNVVASPGGVHNILIKWEAMGFITFAFEGARPLTFASYTDAAREVGLTKLKIAYYTEQQRQRTEARRAKA